jgi:hypothetical protein
MLCVSTSEVCPLWSYSTTMWCGTTGWGGQTWGGVRSSLPNWGSEVGSTDGSDMLSSAGGGCCTGRLAGGWCCIVRAVWIRAPRSCWTVPSKFRRLPSIRRSLWLCNAASEVAGGCGMWPVPGTGVGAEWSVEPLGERSLVAGLGGAVAAPQWEDG